jgi:sulfate/thiosulfate transport system substrate-binding protein
MNIFSSRPWRRSLITAAIGALAITSAATASGASSGTQLALVAYSTPKPAYAKLIAAYQATAAGKSVAFTQSFGPSGTQANDVVQGQPADVVNFSTEADIDKLVNAGLVSTSWDLGPTKGIVTDSVVVFVVRKGNPLGIKNWSDLTNPGVKIVTPNPFTSGAARWNILAAYGAQTSQGDSASQATSYLKSFFQNVVSQPASASLALEAFQAGTGNVLLDYEDDAIQAIAAGAKISYVIPPQTILIQNPIAWTIKSPHLAAAKAFVNWLESPAGQTLWGKLGYRPVLPAIAAKFNFPKPATLFTIKTFGGWSTANKTIFSQNGIVAQIEQNLGVAVGS